MVTETAAPLPIDDEPAARPERPERQALLERSLKRGYAPLGRRDVPAAGELVNLGLGSIVALNVSGYIEHRFVPNRAASELVADVG